MENSEAAAQNSGGVLKAKVLKVFINSWKNIGGRVKLCFSPPQEFVWKYFGVLEHLLLKTPLENCF